MHTEINMKIVKRFIPPTRQTTLSIDSADKKMFLYDFTFLYFSENFEALWAFCFNDRL